MKDPEVCTFCGEEDKQSHDCQRREYTLAEIKKSYWYKTRPPAVQRAVLAYPPGLYRYGPHRVLLCAYSQSKDGSCTLCRVKVLRRYNPGIALEREVFGVELRELIAIDTVKTE